MDCADPNINTPVRNTTLTALQALALLNDPFVLDQARYFADRLKGSSSSLQGQVASAVKLAYGREATESERAALAEYAGKYGLAAMCRLIYNANEFLFID